MESIIKAAIKTWPADKTNQNEVDSRKDCRKNPTDQRNAAKKRNRDSVSSIKARPTDRSNSELDGYRRSEKRNRDLVSPIRAQATDRSNNDFNGYYYSSEKRKRDSVSPVRARATERYNNERDDYYYSSEKRNRDSMVVSKNNDCERRYIQNSMKNKTSQLMSIPVSPPKEEESKWSHEKMIELLSVGSSEADIFLEGTSLLKNQYGIRVTVQNKPWCKLDDCLGELRRVLTRNTDIITIWALTPFAWREITIKTTGKRNLTVFQPNPNVSIDHIPDKMNRIMEYIRQINDHCVVYLVIPSVKDMYQFNQIRLVRAWGFDYQHFLQKHPLLNPQNMQDHSVFVYNLFTSLSQPEYHWTDKNIIQENGTINCYFIRKHKHHKHIIQSHVRYLKKEHLHLDLSLLPDGLHGNFEFLKYFLVNNNRFFNKFRAATRRLTTEQPRKRAATLQHQRMGRFSGNSPANQCEESDMSSPEEEIAPEFETRLENTRIATSPTSYEVPESFLSPQILPPVDWDQPSTSYKVSKYTDRKSRSFGENSSQRKTISNLHPKLTPPPFTEKIDRGPSSLNPSCSPGGPPLVVSSNVLEYSATTFHAKIRDCIQILCPPERRSQSNLLYVLEGLHKALNFEKDVISRQRL